MRCGEPCITPFGQLPRRLTDVRDEVVADLGHRARPHLVALAQDRTRCRRRAGRAASPAGSSRRRRARRAAARACPIRRSRSAGAAAAPDAAAGRPRPPMRRRSTRSCSASRDRVERLVGDRAPALERHAERVELAFHVTGADADDHAAVRERVERRERLRRLERMLVRGDEHVGHQPRARRVRGEEAERRDRVEPLRRHHLRRLARDRDVMAHRDVEEPGVVARLRDAAPCRRRCASCSHGIDTRTESACTGSCIP